MVSALYLFKLFIIWVHEVRPSQHMFCSEIVWRKENNEIRNYASQVI